MKGKKEKGSCGNNGIVRVFRENISPSKETTN